MAAEPIYKVIFLNQNQVFELYAKQIYQSDLYGFIEVEEYVFGERSQIVVDPAEEKLKSEFAGVKRSYIPMHAIVRIDEVRQSVSLIEQIAKGLPAGRTLAEAAQRPAPQGGEGLALVEGFRGDVLAWVRLTSDGRIARCHLRDPSWFQWPLLEAAIEGNIVADFPLCNKSFNCSYSGHDL